MAWSFLGEQTLVLCQQAALFVWMFVHYIPGIFGSIVVKLQRQSGYCKGAHVIQGTSKHNASSLDAILLVVKDVRNNLTQKKDSGEQK